MKLNRSLARSCSLRDRTSIIETSNFTLDIEKAPAGRHAQRAARVFSSATSRAFEIDSESYSSPFRAAHSLSSSRKSAEVIDAPISRARATSATAWGMSFQTLVAARCRAVRGLRFPERGEGDWPLSCAAGFGFSTFPQGASPPGLLGFSFVSVT